MIPFRHHPVQYGPKNQRFGYGLNILPTRPHRWKIRIPVQAVLLVSQTLPWCRPLPCVAHEHFVTIEFIGSPSVRCSFYER